MSEAQRATVIRAGDVDWAALWREKVEARLADNPPAEAAAGGNRWDARAPRFARMSRALDPSADPLAVALRDAVQPSDAVLDVGAGAGRYTFVLAPLVDRVTAVEPSPGMRSALESAAAARRLTNVTVVSSTWQEAEVQPHDVALVVNVLYFVPDAVSFIEKLDRSARRACYIFHRVEEMASIIEPLRSEVGRRRPSEPGFLELYNLLFTMGIRPNVSLVRPSLGGRYGSLDEAIYEVRQQFLGLDPEDHAHDDRIRAFLADALVKTEGGLGFARGPQMAILSWNKDR